MFARFIDHTNLLGFDVWFARLPFESIDIDIIKPNFFFIYEFNSKTWDECFIKKLPINCKLKNLEK